MLRECHATHVLRGIWDAEFDGDIQFQIGPEERSISGQARSNWVKLPNFKFSHKNIPSLSSFVSKFQKHISFYVRHL